MKLYKTTITPISNFATSLKGDTLFGQICWAIRYTFGNDKLESLLSNYQDSPFLVVSDGFAKGFVPKPSLPSTLLGENLERKKENRKNIWLTLEQLQNGEFNEAINDQQAGNKTQTVATVKNSLNYKTFTTDDSGEFAPYSENESAISPKDVYFLVNNIFSIEELSKALKTLSLIGFGKNSSIGKGFFGFCNLDEVKITKSSKTFMTLSPSVLYEQNIKNSYYEPFTKFGKHGAELANRNPFKKPLLLANTGAIVVFDENNKKSYIGKAIMGHSVHEETVHQGYAILIPTKDIN